MQEIIQLARQQHTQTIPQAVSAIEKMSEVRQREVFDFIDLICFRDGLDLESIKLNERSTKDLREFSTVNPNKEILKNYIGKWTNEGDCTSQYSHFLDVELSYDYENEYFNGVINSHFNNNDNLLYASFIGYFRRNRINGEVFIINNGKKEIVAKVTFKFEGSKLNFQAKEIKGEFLPSETPLWKND